MTASGAPYEFDEWNLSDLQQDGVIYPGAPYPVAVAVSSAGQGMVAVGISRSSGPAVYAFPVGKPAPVIFAITGDALSGEPGLTLNVLPV